MVSALPFMAFPLLLIAWRRHPCTEKIITSEQSKAIQRSVHCSQVKPDVREDALERRNKRLFDYVINYILRTYNYDLVFGHEEFIRF